MKLIGLVYLAWVLSALSSAAAIAIGIMRHKLAGFGRAMACAGGTILLTGFVLAAIGASEGSWTARSPALWLCCIAGAFGLALQAWGWRGVLRPRRGPGQCPRCGYELGGLARCPECGPESPGFHP